LDIHGGRQWNFDSDQITESPMKLRLLILLAAAALAAAPAAGQTVKSLGYNTTNGQIVYSGSNSLTFTNALQFSTNARAATRTNLGGTTVGNAVFTAAFSGTARTALGASVVGANIFTVPVQSQELYLRINADNTVSSLSPAATRTNLGLGATNNVTFSNITASGTLTATGNATLDGVNNTAPQQTADSAASLMTRELSDARYAETAELLTSVYDVPSLNVDGSASGLTGFSATYEGGTASTFTGSSVATNSYAVWRNGFNGGAAQSSGYLAPVSGYGLSATVNMAERNDTYARLIVAGLSTNTDITLGVLTQKGFGLEIDRSLAGTTNNSTRMRVIYNDGSTNHLGAWSTVSGPSTAKYMVWVINKGTNISGYFQSLDINQVPPETFTALSPVATTDGDNFLTGSSFTQTFQFVSTGSATSFYADISRIKQTYNLFPE